MNDTELPTSVTISPRQRRSLSSLLVTLGPGLITGAADDDLSGIATYSQAGSQFGYALSWTMLLTFPLLACIREISARVGRVTGRGIAANLRAVYPRSVLVAMVLLLTIANTVNLGADLGAIGEAVKLLIGGPGHLYVIAFGVLCAMAQVFIDYRVYVRYLKWLTLSLLAYVATVFAITVPWGQVLLRTVVPSFSLTSDYFTAVVGVFGTTLSPYLIFWQAAEEVEDLSLRRDSTSLLVSPEAAQGEIHRIRLDTWFGIGFSNIIGLCIIVATAATLNAQGIVNITSAAQAAEALRPIAGRFASFAFAAGIVGTGLLAVPVLAGSAAYAMGDALERPVGLARRPAQARTFYGVIAGSTLIGVALHFLPIDPIKAPFWSAVLNGVLVVPIMVVLMFLSVEMRVMGKFVLPRTMRWGGWIATVVIGAVVVAMVVSWFV